MREPQQFSEFLDRLVLLRNCYPMRSAYDREPIISIGAMISYAEHLASYARRMQDAPYAGWFRRSV